MQAERNFISPVYLMAAPPSDRDAIIPPGFEITKLPARYAAGAKKSRGGAIVGGTSPRDVALSPEGNKIRGWASRGW